LTNSGSDFAFAAARFWCKPQPAFKSSVRKTVKYIISWFERPQGSPMEYENVQKRIPVEDAVRAELEVIPWRDGLKRS
jgi:hypothetical protein